MKILMRTGLVLLALVVASAPARADHRRDYDTIVGFYQQYLKRSPAPREVRGWIENMRQTGFSLFEVEAGILGSREYFDNHRRDPRSWARGLYIDALDREPDRAEVRIWVDRLHQLRGNYARAVEEFLTEARGRDGYDDEYRSLPRRSYPARVPPRYSDHW